MTWDAVIFDLDGTLLDTLEDLADSMNAALARQGFAPRASSDYRLLVGEGMRVLCERVLPEDERNEATIEGLMEAMRSEYGRGWAHKSRPYKGIPELLDALTSRGLPLAVLSNKPHDFTQEMVKAFLGRWSFTRVCGLRPGFPRKPDPIGALQIARALGVEPGRVVFVGDTNVDMCTAVNAGMLPVGVLWGFRGREELVGSGARLLVGCPADLLALFG